MNKENLIIKLNEVLSSNKSHLSNEDAEKIKEVIVILSSKKLTKAEKLEILFVLGRFATEIAPDIWQHFSQ